MRSYKSYNGLGQYNGKLKFICVVVRNFNKLKYSCNESGWYNLAYRVQSLCAYAMATGIHVVLSGVDLEHDILDILRMKIDTTIFFKSDKSVYSQFYLEDNAIEYLETHATEGLIYGPSVWENGFISFNV